MEDLIGKTLDNTYRVEEYLGQAVMGAVYAAHDIAYDRRVALKVIHSHIVRRERFRDRFLALEEAVTDLDHPGIVKVYAFSRNREVLYIVMEFVHGQNLRDALRILKEQQQIISLPESLAIAQLAAEALDYAHSRGVYHADIKPSNIILRPMPRGQTNKAGIGVQPIITDFGTGKLAETGSQTYTEMPDGTQGYMAPEQWEGAQLDGRCDIYALGVVLYELVTGRVPFETKSFRQALLAHTQQAPPPPRSIDPEIPVQVEDIIIKALAKAPEGRYQEAGDFARALRAARRAITRAAGVAEPEPKGPPASEEEQAPPRPEQAARPRPREKEHPPTPVVAEGERPPEPSPEVARAAPRQQQRPPTPRPGPARPVPRHEEPQPGVRPDRRPAIAPMSPFPAGSRLIVKEPDGNRRTVSLEGRRKLTLGRRSDNDVVLTDQRVSRLHAELVYDGSKFLLADLSSTNDTWRGGNRLLPGIPENWNVGERIRVVDYELHVEAPRKQAQPLSAEIPPGGRIVIVERDGTARAVPIGGRDLLVIGRDPRNEVVISESESSRRHAQCSFKNGKFWITDLNSRNGTRLERESLLPNVPQPWRSGRTVYIGRCRLRLELGEEQELADVSSMPVVVIENPDGTTRRVAFDDRGRLVIGRRFSCDIVLDDHRVSRRHAQVTYDGRRFQVTSLDVTNTTALGKDVLLPGIPEIWKSGEIVHVIDYKLRLEVPEVQEAGLVSESQVRARPAARELITVVLEPMQVRVRPGESVVVTARILNRQRRVDHFTTVVRRIPGEWATVPDGELRLAPGDEGTISVQLHPPHEPSSRAGEHPFVIRVTSGADASLSVEATGTLTIEPFYRIALEMAPSMYVNSGQGKLRISNLGNVTEVVDLAGSDPGELLNVAPAPPQVSLAPGQQEELPLSVGLKAKRPIAGTTQTYPFVLSATTARGQAVTSHGSLQVNPVLPAWALPVLLMVGMALVAGAIWGYSSFKKKKEITATETAVAIESETAIAVATGTAALVATEEFQAEFQAAQTAAVEATAQQQASETLLADATAQYLATQVGERVEKEQTVMAEAAAITATADWLAMDTDGDGLTNAEELRRGTDPYQIDTDGDNLTDGDEVKWGLNPLSKDTDGDGLLDNVDPAPLQLPTETPVPPPTPQQ